MSFVPDTGVSWDKAKTAIAMKGWLADQKSVLLFQQQEHGGAFLYKFDTTGDLESVHKRLLQDGIKNHTLAVNKGSVANASYVADAISVYVVDKDGSLHDKVERAAHCADLEYWQGRAELVGTDKEDGTDREQRDDARGNYSKIIEQSSVQEREVWSHVHDRWGEALASGLHPEAIAVGGDKWNRDTAIRLEREYQKAKPALEAIVSGAVGNSGAVAPVAEEDIEEAPDEWSDLASDVQGLTQEKWIDDHKQSYIDSELENWQNEDAPGDARYEVAKSDDKEWMSDALDDLKKDREDTGAKPIPYTEQQLIAAIKIDYDSGHYLWKKGFSVEFARSPR